MMRAFHVISLLMVLLPCYVTCSKPEVSPQHYNIIILGAAGDLAKKYLWKALLNMFSEKYVKNTVHFTIYACSLRNASEGRQALSLILLGLECSTERCTKVKKEFVQATQYIKLKTDADYQDLAERIADNTQSYYGLSSTHLTYEEGRLIYFAIPPSAYIKTAKKVNKYLRPQIGQAWFRIALEKPFGYNLQSAEHLSVKLGKYFKESEIYRVDHYLGKSVVRLLLQFRYVNSELYGPLWNHDHIEKVEIVISEKRDVKDRIEFYEEVGVIRDVFQNHLTELLSLVAMELPSDSGNITAMLMNKLRILQQVRPLLSSCAVTGQYATYGCEVMDDIKKDNSMTPTFAAVLAHIESGRWKDVPFILTSGKKLNKTESYVRIKFKNNQFCLQMQASNCGEEKQIVFHIGSDESLKPPMIAISKALPKPKNFFSWKLDDTTKNINFFGQSIQDMYQVMPMHEIDEMDAYSFLIKALMDGQKQWFTYSDNLMAAWTIWTPLLESLSNIQPRIYHGGHDINNLNFMYMSDSLDFIDQTESTSTVQRSFDDPTFMTDLKNKFRGGHLISHDRITLINKLADHIHECAINAISERGVFHIAFSGGESPKALMKALSRRTMFPWKKTHVWLVDERCVRLDDKSSNFGMIQNYLLQYINLPYINIHPMPVQLYGTLCDPNDQGDMLYESAMKRELWNGSFDFVLLGIGSDGHTASLFPNQTALEEDKRWVTYSKSSASLKHNDRITLTFRTINEAKNIAVMVTGQSKKNIVKDIRNSDIDIKRYPATGVLPSHGTVTWFIDKEALQQ